MKLGFEKEKSNKKMIYGKNKLLVERWMSKEHCAELGTKYNIYLNFDDKSSNVLAKVGISSEDWTELLLIS